MDAPRDDPPGRPPGVERVGRPRRRRPGAGDAPPGHRLEPGVGALAASDRLQCSDSARAAGADAADEAHVAGRRRSVLRLSVLCARARSQPGHRPGGVERVAAPGSPSGSGRRDPPGGEAPSSDPRAERVGLTLPAPACYLFPGMLRALLTALILTLLSLPAAAQRSPVILSTTTSTQDSGLLDVLVPLFEQKTGYTVKTIADGTGHAPALHARGAPGAVP